MKSRLRFLLFYFLFWLAFFQLARLAFLLYHLNSTKKLPFSDTLLTFLYGLKMDMSLTAYLLIPVCLFILLSVWIPFFRKRLVYLIYTSLCAFILLLIVAADLELYAQWGFRIDDTPLKYMSSPNEVWASISHLPLLLIGIGIVAGAFVLFYIVRLLLRKTFLLPENDTRKMLTTLAIAALFPVLIIAVRGGFQLSPMNQSAVYFSKNNFANIAAINAGWNFMHAVSSGAERNEKAYQYFSEKEMRSIVDSLYRTSYVSQPSFSGKPNIILVIWESFTEKAIHLSVEGKPVTPYFNKLKEEGLYFSNTYASGDRTDKGLSAILSGYPALNKTSIIRTPSKLTELSSLPKVLKTAGYQSSFYYGGETEFANIKSYLYQSEFHRIIDKDFFPRRKQNSKWGAHDGVVAEQVMKDIASFPNSFFLTWLTLTSHEPYEVPDGFEHLQGDDADSRFLNSISYTDKVVDDLVKFCKSQPWWKETVLVIVGDHGHILPETGKREEDFRIPMLWLGGALKQKGIVDAVVSQLGIGSTITQGLGLPPLSRFSNNLFDTVGSKWAFFTYNNAFGFIKDDCSLLFDNTGRNIIHTRPSCSATAERAGKALQQDIYHDFLSK